nr:Uncharacterised protein [Klebsiella pneumoniae]
MQQLEISQQIVVKGRRRWAIFHHKNCRTKKRSIHAQNKTETSVVFSSLSLRKIRPARGLMVVRR